MLFFQSRSKFFESQFNLLDVEVKRFHSIQRERIEIFKKIGAKFSFETFSINCSKIFELDLRDIFDLYITKFPTIEIAGVENLEPNHYHISPTVNVLKLNDIFHKGCLLPRLLYYDLKFNDPDYLNLLRGVCDYTLHPEMYPRLKQLQQERKKCIENIRKISLKIFLEMFNEPPTIPRVFEIYKECPLIKIFNTGNYDYIYFSRGMWRTEKFFPVFPKRLTDDDKVVVVLTISQSACVFRKKLTD